MDREEFIKTMQRIEAAYPGKFRLTEDVLDTWYECLCGLDGEELRRSAIRYIRENRFPPAPADLREGCMKAGRERLEGKAEIRLYYDALAGLYPGAHYDGDAERIFTGILKKRGGDMEKAAGEIIDRASAFVLSAERSKGGGIISLSAFLEKEYGGCG